MLLILLKHNHVENKSGKFPITQNGITFITIMVITENNDRTQ